MNKGKNVDISILEQIITDAYNNNLLINKDIESAVIKTIAMLDEGKLRVAHKHQNEWVTTQWLKQAILLYFKLRPMQQLAGNFWDKVNLKFANWTSAKFKEAGFRAVPGAIVREGAYVAPNVVLMPSFVNIGAYIDENTMIDSWATVGSCAQIGSNVHISGGAGIGGVLEPLQSTPTIIEDNCFIGARSEVVEGCRIGTGSVLSMGVFIGKSTKIIDRETGEIHYGAVPPYSVVVPGSAPAAPGKPSLYCAVIVKKVDEQTRAKTSINELLRD